MGRSQALKSSQVLNDLLNSKQFQENIRKSYNTLADPMANSLKSYNTVSRADNYWKDRVDLLIYEKKNWIKARMDFRKEIRDLQTEIDRLNSKNKQLMAIIDKVGSEEEVRISKLFVPAKPEKTEKTPRVLDDQSLKFAINREVSQLLTDEASINFHFDQKALHGHNSKQQNPDSTILAKNLYLDDRDMLIQKVRQRNTGLENLRGSMEGFGETPRQQDKKSIPQPNKIEIRMKNRLYDYGKQFDGHS